MTKVSKVFSALPIGFDGQIIEIETDVRNGLPGFTIVGMANKTIEESKERIRSAVKNSGFDFPNRKLVVNLAPAELRKDGPHLDMAIAVGILARQGVLSEEDIGDCIFAGELALNGDFRAIGGTINIIEAARAAGFKRIFVPAENARHVSLARGIKIFAVKNLDGLVAYFSSKSPNENVVEITTLPKNTSVKSQNKTSDVFLDDVSGQEVAKRALLIALAGRHNILLHGPPGSGKTMLAKVARNLLPPLSQKEMVDVVKINSLIEPSFSEPRRPFRAPHHTASQVALIGGGQNGTPGEISLAHTGILFLDEIPEYPRSVLEALRQPLEDKKITISRANAKVSYPADFMLIATMNPCPCGYLGSNVKECSCTQPQILSYNKRLSGPLLDRFDMTVNVAKVESKDALKKDISPEKSKHEEAEKTILKAREKQTGRFGRCNFYNTNMSSSYIKNKLPLPNEATKLLSTASEKLSLSMRSYFKIIRLARTIADIEGDENISVNHISEALQFRQDFG